MLAPSLIVASGEMEQVSDACRQQHANVMQASYSGRRWIGSWSLLAVGCQSVKITARVSRRRLQVSICCCQVLPTACSC
jgi:hypothetical protein